MGLKMTVPELAAALAERELTVKLYVTEKGKDRALVTFRDAKVPGGRRPGVVTLLRPYVYALDNSERVKGEPLVGFITMPAVSVEAGREALVATNDLLPGEIALAGQENAAGEPGA